MTEAAADTASAQPRPAATSYERVALALVLVFAGVLRLWYGVGLAFTDDFLYVDLSLDAAEAGWTHYLANATHFASTRIGIIGPLASVIRVLPPSERTIAITPFLLSMGTVWCAYALGRVQHSARAGLIAAAFAAVIPIDIWFSTAILPDSFVPFYTGVALFALALSGRANSGRVAVLWACLSGVMVFLAFETRPTSGILLLPIGLAAFSSREQRIVRMFVPPMAFAFAVVVYWLALYAATDSFLLQFEHFTKDATGTRWTGTGKPFEHLQTMLPMFRVFTDTPPLQDAALAQTIHSRVMDLRFGPLYYAAWPAVLFAVARVRSEARYRLPLIAFLTLYLFFEFGSTSPTSYVPIWKLPRFLTILAVPVCVIVGLVVDDLLSRYPTHKTLLTGATAATLAGLLVCLYVATPLFNLKENNRTFRLAYQEVRDLGVGDRVYVVDSRWQRRGSVFLRLSPSLDPEIYDLAGATVSDLAGSTVVFDTAYFTDPETREERLAAIDPALRNVPEHVPPGWRVLSVVPNAAKDGTPAPVYLLRSPTSKD